MWGIEFFVGRYSELGWKYEDVELKQAIRVNSMNIDKDKLVKRLGSRGVNVQKIPFLDDGYWVSEPGFSMGATSEYLLGLYSIQEAAAQIPSTLFTTLKEKTVLDACAAPGGKTVQLAHLMWNTGAVIALDIDRHRLAALSNQLERCHVKNTVVYLADARHASQLNVKFDRILLDVPCSGNFATDKEWFSRRTLKDVERNAVLQREILREAVKTVKADGEIVYSTCSLEPEEDEMNVDWAIRELNVQVEEIECYGQKGLADVFGKKLDSTVTNCKRIWPGSTQGFFVSKLRKRGSS